MQIILTLDTNNEVTAEMRKTTPDETVGFDQILSTMITSLDIYTNRLIDVSKDDSEAEAFRYSLYERVYSVFEAFLNRVFPKESANEFELSDAALVYAEDQIIQQAAEEGITYEEALIKYENKAKEYIDARKMS